MKKLGLILTIISAIGVGLILFNNAFQAYEFFIKYRIASVIFGLVCFISAIIYAILETIDGKGW